MGSFSQHLCRLDVMTDNTKLDSSADCTEVVQDSTLRMEESVTEVALHCRQGVLQRVDGCQFCQQPPVPNHPHRVQSSARDRAGLPHDFAQVLPLSLHDATDPADHVVEDG